MHLRQLKKDWLYLSQEEKISLIERTNERRLAAFDIRIKKSVKGRKSATKRKQTTKKKATAQNLVELMSKMTKEEQENFKLMALMHGKTK